VCENEVRGAGGGKTARRGEARMIRVNGPKEGKGFYTACHVHSHGLVSKSANCDSRPCQNRYPAIDARMSGKGSPCPGAEGMIRRVV
jgi:hypothetical protein